MKILKFKIKKLVKGKGQPKIMIIAGIHGDEKSAVILSKLIFKRIEIKGTLTVISVANVSAFNAGQEKSSIDQKNLNRCFPGKSKGAYTIRLAKYIFDLCQSQDLVIDIHNFQNNSPVLMVLTKTKFSGLRNKLYNLAKIFQPDLVWEINATQQKNFHGSLLGELIKKERLAFGIELPHQRFIKRKSYFEIVRKINKVIHLFYKIDEKKKVDIPVIERLVVKACQKGKITSLVKPLDKVLKGQKIGLLIIKRGEVEIKSPANGLIIETANKQVKNKDKIFTIGKIVNVL